MTNREMNQQEIDEAGFKPFTGGFAKPDRRGSEYGQVEASLDGERIRVEHSQECWTLYIENPGSFRHWAKANT